MDRPLIMAITGSSCGGSVQAANDPSAQRPSAALVNRVCQDEICRVRGGVMRSGRSILYEGQVEAVRGP